MTDGDAIASGLIVLAAGVVALVFVYRATVAMANVPTIRRTVAIVIGLLLVALAVFTLGGVAIVIALLPLVPSIRRGMASRLRQLGNWQALLAGPAILIVAVIASVMLASTPVGLIVGVPLAAALLCAVKWGATTAAAR